jgi:hypothetical protein
VLAALLLAEECANGGETEPALAPHEKDGRGEDAGFRRRSGEVFRGDSNYVARDQPAFSTQMRATMATLDDIEDFEECVLCARHVKVHAHPAYLKAITDHINTVLSTAAFPIFTSAVPQSEVLHVRLPAACPTRHRVPSLPLRHMRRTPLGPAAPSFTVETASSLIFLSYVARFC